MMIKPQLKEFGLDEEKVWSLEKRIRKTSDLLEYTVPVTFGAVIGLFIYFIYYDPLNDPDYFQLGISLFVFGGFGILFMGIPLMFFHVFTKAYIRKLKNNSKEYNALLKYRHKLNLYEQWNLRNDLDFWKCLDHNGLIYEVGALLSKKGYIILDKFNEYSKFDLVVNRNFKTIPVFFLKTKKQAGLDQVRKLYENSRKDNIDTFIIICMKGFTRFVKKFIKDKDIILIYPEILSEYNKNYNI